VWECVVEQWLGVHCVWECVVEQWLGVHCVWECVVEQWLGVHCVWECVVEQWLGVRRVLSNERLYENSMCYNKIYREYVVVRNAYFFSTVIFIDFPIGLNVVLTRTSCFFWV